MIRLWMKKVTLWMAFFIWVTVFVVHPIYTYNMGTARNVSYTIVAEPYIESDRLVYQWHGEIYRSCEVSFTRKIIDANGVIHNLVSGPISNAIARSSLGKTNILIETRIGPAIPAGATSYMVHEVPRCTWLQRMFPNPLPYPPVQFIVERQEDEKAAR